MKNKKFFKRALTFMLCLLFLSVIVTEEPVQAERAPGESVENYLNRCYNGITSIAALNPMPKVIGLAYLVGEDDMAAASWIKDPVTNMVVQHEIYAVDPDTAIQGYKYNSRYYPQNNVEYLRDVRYTYGQGLFATNKINNMPEGAQYLEREGCMFMVVACDEEWVTVWDNGYQSWDLEMSATGSIWSVVCHGGPTDAYLETHPGGFYKIQRNKVWLDFALSENHPYNSEEAIPKAGNGVVTSLAKLRPVPNENEKTDCKSTPVYALTAGTEVNVVSAQLVPSKTPGSTIKYYKVSFNGSEEVQNNRVGYLQYKVPGVYYLDSRYLNFTQKGIKTPDGAVLGEITNVTSGSEVYVYKSKDTGSERIGILTKGTAMEMFPAESDTNWTTVYFNGQKCYVQTKYIIRVKYKVTDISEPYIADVVKDQYVIGWDPGKNNVDFYVELAYEPSGKKKKKVLWKNSHYTDTTFTIARKYMSASRQICVTVQANTKNGEKGEALQLWIDPTMPSLENQIEKQCIKVGKNKIKFPYKWSQPISVQYSTKKNFKKAKLVENQVKKKGRITYKKIKEIKKLKPNKTYYIRYRGKKKVYTAAGEKWISELWSKPIKIKTKKK
ncbi:MAG: hypothetical protein K2K56_08940 [Lachnospiraceae bacterium]|nr:hypothetical protein [Lachnospiraceae bacterium]